MLPTSSLVAVVEVPVEGYGCKVLFAITDVTMSGSGGNVSVVKSLISIPDVALTSQFDWSILIWP